MNYTYCKQWFRAKKRPIAIWDESTARKMHEEGKLYTVVVGAVEHAVSFIEIKGNYIGVGFLDGILREYLSYQFQQRELGQLFLSMATHREFESNSDKVARATTYVFKEDGTVFAEDEYFSSGTKSTWQVATSVSANWEPYPAFGQYTSLLRVERSFPPSET